MRFGKGLLVLTALAGSLLAQTQPSGKDLVNQGVSAFKSGNYPAAVE